jgi:hypothetical protein
MLVSHERQFIYLKTRKTASTSVEIYFEPWCVPEGSTADVQHRQESRISTSGIVGCRGSNTAGKTWYNHMPAENIRELLGDALWARYFKFCLIRNPFDKVVSQFWFLQAKQVRVNLATAEFDLVRSHFRKWVELRCFPLDAPVYSIDGRVIADHIVRYENLEQGLQTVCRQLSIAWEPERLRRYKGDFRVRDEPFQEYYDRHSESLVGEAFQWELSSFGYELRTH